MKKNITKIDYFRFRTKDTPDVIYSVLCDYFGENEFLKVERNKSGYLNYERSYDVLLQNIDASGKIVFKSIATIATGGESMRGWTMFDMSGKGCAEISDWSLFDKMLEEFLKDYQRRRVDIALDTFGGSQFRRVKKAIKQGLFSSSRGIKPTHSLVDNMSQNQGKTVYVGRRTGAKFYRGYEKGLEQIGKREHNKLLKAEDDTVFYEPFVVDGRQVLIDMRDWWRDEVEFKAIKQPLPADIIQCRDAYFAGAYPYLAELIEACETKHILTSAKPVKDYDIERDISNLVTQYQRVIIQGISAYGGVQSFIERCLPKESESKYCVKPEAQDRLTVPANKHKTDLNNQWKESEHDTNFYANRRANYYESAEKD